MEGDETILDYVASTFNRPRPDRHLIEELDPGCYYGQAFSTTLFSTTGKKVVSSGFRIVAEMAAYPDPGRRLIFSGQVGPADGSAIVLQGSSSSAITSIATAMVATSHYHY